MMKWMIFNFIILAVTVLHAKAFIDVKSKVEFSSVEYITLGMISEYQNVPHEIQEKLNKIVLGNAPKAGERRVFSNAAIAMAFRKHLPGDWAKKVQVHIPNEVRVNVRDLKWNQENIKKQLVETWQQHCQDCQLQLQYLNLPYLSSENNIEEWSVDAGKDLPKGSFHIPVYIKQAQQPLKQYWLSGQLRIYKKVPIVAKAMAMGEIFSQDFVEWAERDVTFAYDGTPFVRDILGKRTSQALRAGNIIWQNLILREKAILRGDMVKLIIGTETFEVSTMGRAENDAYVGDTVQVKNLKSNKVVSGAVTGKNEVRIE